MAQRWKLVPTLRHKQCAETSFCGVYIGNGCRKCPKCKTVQPVNTKRKRSSTVTVPRKKKVPSADGDTSTRYNVGDKVKVFWDRYRTWTWGMIACAYDHGSGGPMRDRRYAVKIIGLRPETPAISTWGKWYLQSVKNTHLKRRLTDNDLAETQVRADVMYKDLIQVKSELGPVALKYRIEATEFYPNCACTPCYRKFFDAIFTGPKLMDARLMPLKKGMVIRTDMFNSWGSLCSVSEVSPCRNPEWSSVVLRDCDQESSSYNSTKRMNPKHKWYHYTIEFEDNGKHSYFHIDTAALQLNIFRLLEKADAVCENSTDPATNKEICADSFSFQTNNFDYKIDWEVYTQIKFTNNQKHKHRYWVATQCNIKTNVKRTLYIGSLKQPVQKELSHYRSNIEGVVGKVHDWVWKDKDAALADPLIAGVKHPTTLRLLGMTKFKNNFVDLNARFDFYNKYDIDMRIDRMYHGTNMRNLFPILHPLGGFAMAGEANGKCYGQGIYFAKSPSWVHANGYCPSGVDNIRCVLMCDVILGKKLQNSTDTWHRNASVRGNTSDDRNSSSTNGNVVFNKQNFELTGGSTTREIHVVWYDKCRTDINIKGVLFYK